MARCFLSCAFEQTLARLLDSACPNSNTTKSNGNGRTRVSAQRGEAQLKISDRYCLSYTTISWNGLPSLPVPSMVNTVVFPSFERTELLFAALPSIFQVCSTVWSFTL